MLIKIVSRDASYYRYNVISAIASRKKGGRYNAVRAVHKAECV